MGLLLLLCTAHASAQSNPNVPEKYKRLFFHYSDQRSRYEKALNSLGLTSRPVGRSFALIAGVTQYPNFPELERSLKPAEVDIEKLTSYLKDQEFFDEIVVLKDGDMTLDNLNYFLENYFPIRIANSPHSRFLFAYSGHGYGLEGKGSSRGFLLTSSATSLLDPANRIDLGIVRTLLEPVIDSSEKVLVLINACHSGAFLGRRSFGADALGPGERGAHAIMASRSNQSSLHLDKVGPGSVFFEKLFAGLAGVADISPRDGVVTYHELDTYLRSEIRQVTNGLQTPIEGDISRDGSIGEFFFLNRGRQVALGNVKAWDPGSATTFGTVASDEVEKGSQAFLADDFDHAFQLFKKAAEAGNAQAMGYVGYLYQFGRGVSQDYLKAQQWYERGIAAGDPTSMNNLGYMYEKGSGLNHNYEKAMTLYQQAAAMGNAGSMQNLADLYEAGVAIKQDRLKALQWYRAAAEAGSAHAMTELGIIYQFGRGITQDYKQALQWYERAANANDPVGVNNLGWLYKNGYGTERDYDQARHLFDKAAAMGQGDAMANLGSLYEDGLGVQKDLEQARTWYEKGVAVGAPVAMNNLGYLYYKGHGVKQDYEQARQWYQKAIELGNSTAMCNLGLLYENGNGVKQDYSMARQWYEKGAAFGGFDIIE